MTFKNANILIVDDDDANINVLAGLLEMQGYTNIKSTTDPRLVVDFFKSFQPDLILLDLMMPYLTGYEILEQLKELVPDQSYLPVLVLTAEITAEAKQRALSSGAKDFLTKPFDLVEVGLRIENLLYARFLYLQLQSQYHDLENKLRERTILELRVAERTAQLKAANKELEAFSFSVSHDLRAPLRHIKGFINLLKEYPVAVPRTEEELFFLKIIEDGADGMFKLIDALLSFSRLNRTEIQKTTIDSLSMVKKVIQFFEPETKSRSITFHVGQLHHCEGDEQLIKQVWVNLISNAIKYTGKRINAVVEIGSILRDREIVYFVKDNGAGFDMKYAAKLFSVFQRLHKTSDFEGVGIGLANVNSIITRHGGNCTAEGEIGAGATFSFTLPR
jgi:two-component system, sensor histidine kinase and response regulator